MPIEQQLLATTETITTVISVLHHRMSLMCCMKSHHTPATLEPAHTPCLFSVDLRTIRQHLVAHFLLILLPTILTHIHFHPAQRGYRSKHSTCTALSTITADISSGFSRKKPVHRTVLVALDVTAAFDNVDHQQLLDCVINTNMPSTIRRWLYNCMQNRGAKVHFRQIESKSRKVKRGVVQGGVLSPALFHYYLADFPTPPPSIKLIMYAMTLPSTHH